MTAVRIPSTGDAEDTAYERERQRKLDDQIEAEMEAKRMASGVSREELSLIDAGNAGRNAGMLGHDASMNPYPHGCIEHAEWDRHRLATLCARLNGRAA